MSVEQLRRLKLFKQLQEDHQHSKSEVRRRKFKSPQDLGGFVRKLNKNKKHQLEEERNTEIEKNNRMLYERIVSQFKQEQPQSTTSKRMKWHVRKNRKATLREDPQQPEPPRRTSSKMNLVAPRDYSHQHSNQTLEARGRIEAPKTLFYGMELIDGVEFKIKILLSGGVYYLIGKNHDAKLLLQMEEAEYMRLHNGELKGNPCGIFRFLQIVDGQVRFRLRKPESRQSVQQSRARSRRLNPLPPVF